MDPRDRVAGPAIGLIVVAVIGFIMQAMSIVMNLLGVGLASTQGPGAQFQQMLSGVVGIIFAVIGMIVAGFILFGALKMKSLQSYGLAMAAAIIAMVPCISPCCCIGLPVGIWALLVLMNAEVKAGFYQMQGMPPPMSQMPPMPPMPPPPTM